MTLEESDLKLLHDIANRRAFLKAPGTPLLRGTLAATMRRRHELMTELARLEEQWLNCGLSTAGLPANSAPASQVPAPLGPREVCPYSGPELHHF